MAKHRFVHLHNHTDYSVRDGRQRIEPMLMATHANRQNAIAITDHGTLAGAWDLARTAKGLKDKDIDIKPIIGLEAYLVNDRSRSERIQLGKGRTSSYYHITLLAQTNQGYRNLVEMTSIAWEDVKSGSKPLIDFALLADHSEGIIALTGCLSGSVLAHLAHKDYESAKANLDTLTQIFDKDHLFVEFMTHGIDIEDKAFGDLLNLQRYFGLEPVITNDAHFTFPAEARFQEGQLALTERRRLSDPLHWKFDGEGYWLRSTEEMWQLFGTELPRGLVNTTRIASMIDDNVLPEEKIRIPKYTLPNGEPLPVSSAEYLKKKINEGAHRIYGSPLPVEVKRRLKHEYNMIVSKHFEDYFLVVADMLDSAREKGILVGPGRGSAAGSLVAYCLNIVKIDALKYDLLFERFLNVDRTEMPDIDSDFEHTRRDEVIQDLAERWHPENVARIGTFGYSRSKRAIKDAAFLLDKDEIGNKLSKYVTIGAACKPFTISELMDENFEMGEKFREIVTTEGAEDVIEMARGLEDSIQSNGIHACGVLIATEPINTLVPTRVSVKNGRRTRVTEWEHHDIAQLGLLKLDALGLQTLGIAGYAIKYIKSTKGIDIDLDHLPDANDLSIPEVQRTWDFIGSGNTGGIFQLESSGMQTLCVKVQPHSIAQLGAVIALYRPGPMGEKLHDRYAAVKAAGKGPDYSNFTSDPKEIEVIDRVLHSTIGIPIYQEQLMALSGVVAGFSATNRELVRKVVSKKDQIKMAKVGEDFLKGAQMDVDQDGQPKLVFSQATAQRLWDAIKSAGAYAFNASHAIGYAQLSWEMAYLRANWPAEMGAAMLAVANQQSRDKTVSAVRAVRKFGIDVQLPDINIANELPTVHDGAVVLGLSQIMELHKDMIERIIQARDANGPFTSVTDLLRRVALNRRAIIALAEAGALDSLGARLGIIMSLATLQAFTSDDDAPLDIEWSPQERAWREAKRLGVLLSVDLLTEYKEELEYYSDQGVAVFDVDDIIEMAGTGTNMSIAVQGVVTSFALITKGLRRASVELSGINQSVQGMIWGSTLDKVFTESKDDPLKVGDLVVVTGRPKLYKQTRTIYVGIDAEEGGEEESSQVEEEIAIPQITIDNVTRIGA